MTERLASERTFRAIAVQPKWAASDFLSAARFRAWMTTQLESAKPHLHPNQPNLVVLTELNGLPLVLRGARERLTPILMTTGATGLAILPLVLYGNLPGHEIEYPMAVVILGGLVTSTLLNLFVVPALYLRYGAGTVEIEGQQALPSLVPSAG